MTEETINEIKWTIHETHPEMVKPARERLSEIVDPEIGMDIIQLGLVRDVARAVGDAPSTLHLIFPEVFLGAGDAPLRIRQIQETRHRYLPEGLLRDHAGAI